jgi:hypothetical protein
MAQTCSKCSRINPPEAVYCYFDGHALAGHARNGGPVATAAQPFLNHFVFPSGRACRNFNELAIACHEEWQAARDLLQQGYLENFLGNLGRSDLALAAREAAHFPDRDRGLDQLLEKLPCEVLEPPKLRVEPQDVNLGVVPVGQDRTFDLHLENQGMRLLYGSVTSDDCLWLALGDPPGASEKLFEFRGEQVIPVRVRGKHLRAGTKPLEGRLVIESNGGTTTVTVRADVPVKPFPDGPLAGAKTPRQVAEKAKAAPKEAAAYFEKRAVAKWYKDNGWTYPVRGPAASGLGAVQQFFEALGLTPPPKVEINQQSVALEGAVGAPLRHTLEVSTQEKRPVYAYAGSDQPWLEVGRPKLNGRTAVIPLVIPAVPNRAGETLTARVTVTSNGQQRFVVPVTLAVVENFDFSALAAASPAPPRPEPKPEPKPEPAAETKPASVTVVEPPALTPPPRKPTPRPARTGPRLNPVHAVPAALLALALVGVLALDFLLPSGLGGPVSFSQPGPDTPYTDLVDSEPRLGIEFSSEARFGLSMLKEHDPEVPERLKRLTYDDHGSSNNTCIRLDGQENLFGRRPGRWVKKLEKAKYRQRWTCVWEYPERVVVTQVVELVPGQSRLLDTVLVHYTLENRSNLPHKVGLRFLLDTFIGANDGVPFRIPGRSDFLETMEDFDQKQVPDYVQAWERPDLKDPGTIAHLGLKGIDLPDVDIEPIESMSICKYPGNADERWKWARTPINDTPEKKDSCVVLYWADRDMPVNERRDMAFTYGLNAISSMSSGNADMSLTAGGSFRKGGQFTLTATVKNPQEGQKVRVQLPRGLILVEGQDAEQVLPGGGDYAQVSWRVRSSDVGEYLLEVLAGASRETYKVRITNRTIFE